MAMFLGHIALVLSTLLVGLGLVLIQRSREWYFGTRTGVVGTTVAGTPTETNPALDTRNLVNIAGWIFLIVGAISFLCVVYSLFHYWNIGEFENAYPVLARRPF